MPTIRAYRHTNKPEYLNKEILHIDGVLSNASGDQNITLLCVVPRRSVHIPIYHPGAPGTDYQNEIDQQVAAGLLKKVWVFRNPLDTPNYVRKDFCYDIFDVDSVESGLQFSTPVGDIATAPGEAACASFNQHIPLAQHLRISDRVTRGTGGLELVADGVYYNPTTNTYDAYPNYKLSEDSEHWYFNVDDYNDGKKVHSYSEYTQAVFKITPSSWEELNTRNDELFWATVRSTVRTGQWKSSEKDRMQHASPSDITKSTLDSVASLRQQLANLNSTFDPENFLVALNALNEDLDNTTAAKLSLEADLAAENSKANPDANTVASLEAQISSLEAQLSVKRADVDTANTELSDFIEQNGYLTTLIEQAYSTLDNLVGYQPNFASHNHKLFKQDGDNTESTHVYNNGFTDFPDGPPDADGTNNRHTWGDFGSADSGGVGYNPVSVVDFKWPPALSYSDFARSSNNSCAEYGVDDYDSTENVTDLYLDTSGWARFCGFGYGRFPFEHGVKTPFWQYLYNPFDSAQPQDILDPFPIERIGEFGPICTGGPNAGRNAVCFTYGHPILMTPPDKLAYNLHSYRVADYIVVEDEEYYGLLNEFLGMGMMRVKEFNASIGESQWSEATIASVGGLHDDLVHTFLESVRLRYGMYDWRAWFTEPGMMFEAYTPTDPESAIPLDQEWVGDPSAANFPGTRYYQPVPVITPSFIPGAPINLEVRITATPGSPPAPVLSLSAPPGAPTDLILTTLFRPGAPSDLELTAALTPGAPTDLELTRALTPGAPTDLELTKALTPGAPTDLELTKALTPGAPTGLAVSRLLAPGAPTDLNVSRLLSPGAPTDLTLSILPAPGAPTDLAVSILLFPGAPTDLTVSILTAPGVPTDLILSRLSAPGIPNITGLSASDTATNTFIVEGSLSSGGSGGSGGSGDPTSSVATPISLSSQFGSPVFNFTDAEIQKLSNGAITIGGFYAIEVLPNTPPRLVLAEELTF